MANYEVYVLIIAVVLIGIVLMTNRQREWFDGITPNYLRDYQDIPNDIPSFDAYQIMEQPSDPRYVWVPEANGYLLPYDELDFGLPYHRWMYYYFPGYYSQYYDNNWPFDYPWPHDLYYGGSYGGDYGGDFYGYRGDYYKYRYRSGPGRNYNYRISNDISQYYPNRANMPLVYTESYPTRRSGFAGGQYSQRFAGRGSRGSGLRIGSNTPSFNGRIAKTREHFSTTDCAPTYKSNICTSLIDPMIADRGGNANGAKACRPNDLLEKFGNVESVDGVFTSNDPNAYMEPIQGILTFQVKPSDITDGSNWPTASGYPALPTYPATEVYPNPDYVPQDATTYHQTPAEGYLTPSGLGNYRAQFGFQGIAFNSQGNTEGSIEAPIYGQFSYGEQEYSPQDRDYFTYPTLNKGYLNEKTNPNYENEPEFIRHQQVIACEQENDTEFCRQKYGVGYAAQIGKVSEPLMS